jgi:dTDP-4-amino-4,6-dideoxygalactose transaminase
MKKIKFLDLRQENDIVKKACLEKISKLADSSSFMSGYEVGEFEKKFAKYCGSEFCLGVGSGTDALRTALLACGISAQDEVITTPISYTSTSLAIAHCNAKPIFVDVLENGNIDPDKIEKAITAKTKAILIVHMYGNPCDMNKIRKITKKHRLFLIDDCAHAQGSVYFGKRIGSLADISCFSFYPTKNLGAWGDAGAITTNSEDLYKKAFLYKNYGEYVQNYSEVIGYNTKLDAIQAIVLTEKLKYLNTWNKMRTVNAEFYTRELNGVGDIKTIGFNKGCSYYNFPIRTKKRDNLVLFLKNRGINVFIRYPLAIHLQKCFKYLGYKKGDLPFAEAHASTVVSLPFYPFLSAEDRACVVSEVKNYFKK